MQSSVWSEIEDSEYFGQLAVTTVSSEREERWGPFREVRRGRLSLAERDVPVIVALPEIFPHKKPVCFVMRPDDVGMIPHVDPDGFICYADDEEVLLDPENPRGILREAVELVRRLLQKGINGENTAEFVDEFESYWGREHPDKMNVASFVTINEELRSVHAAKPMKYKRTAESNPVAYFNDSPSPPAYRNREKRKQINRFPPALYVPFQPGTILQPPEFGEVWTLEEMRRFVKKHVSRANKCRLLQLKHKLRAHNHCTIFALPQQDGGHAVFGVCFRRKQDGNRPLSHPFVTRDDHFEPEPLEITRLDREFLIERGGGNPRLAEKKVLIAGCGAVGSVVADQLVKAGIGQLNLVDPDSMGFENTYRHTLGRREAGTSKVEAIQGDLQSKFPYLTVETHQSRIENLLDDELLAEIDMVLVAIGDPNIELLVNERLHQSNDAPPVVFTWLEPLGIGGHALLANAEGDDGCFACLFEHSSPDVPCERFFNAASFAAPDQSFAKRLGGCRTTFVPYGAVDATRTACLAAELAVGSLCNRAEDHPLRSWKGDPSDFLSKGFELSRRFEYDRQQLHDQRYEYKSSTCSICQGAG